MEVLFSKLPYAGVIAMIAIVIVGIAVGIYLVDQWRDKKRVVKDNADDRLNGILEKTVKELETKVDKLVKREIELTKEVGDLRKDNERLIAILQGRDSQTQKFYEQGFESMRVTSEMFKTLSKLVETVAELGKGISKNNEMTAEFVKTVKEHFLNVEKAVISKK